MNTDRNSDTRHDVGMQQAVRENQYRHKSKLLNINTDKTNSKCILYVCVCVLHKQKQNMFSKLMNRAKIGTKRDKNQTIIYKKNWVNKELFSLL